MSKKDAASVMGRMPPKYHTLPGEPFDAMKSEVCDFMMQMPEVRNYMFDTLKDMLVYDPVTHQWRGKYYQAPGGGDRP